MEKNTIDKITSELQNRYPELGLRSLEVNEATGSSTLYIDPSKKSLAFLDNPIIPHVYRTKASTITRDSLSRSYLDLSSKKDSYDEDPKKLYEKVIRYYYTEPLVGSTINLLSSLSCKGFENDIDDPDIKNFYDTWVFDVNFEEVLEWIFLDLFRTSNVVTYSVVVDAPNPDLKLKPGLTASIIIYTQEVENVLTIPAKALRFKPDSTLMAKMPPKAPNTSQTHVPGAQAAPESQAVQAAGGCMSRHG